MKREQKIKVGITHGDINGIGYELIIKAFDDPRMVELCTPVIYGSPKVAAYHRKVLEMETFMFHQIRSATEADPKKVNIINCCDENVRVELGHGSDSSGEAAYLALEHAVNDLKQGKIDVLVTAPVNKKNIQSEAFNFPGHTEYLSRHFNTRHHVMLLITDNLKVGVVTGHVPVDKISEMITKEIIIAKLRVLHRSLVVDFAKTNPRIAVLGLNPHAGDDGVLGSEENEIIIPAIKKAWDEGITALGPFAADGFFGSGQQYKFDAVLAMYHDQGLAPFKALTFDMGVNYTAGLPIVRTSPGHGTAFDIAGQNIASIESFLQAIYFAIDIYRNRLDYEEMSKNPLPKYEINANGESEDVDLMTTEEDPQAY
jgi:4-hydroxythreonine-4-phosphate dehydrogenase